FASFVMTHLARTGLLDRVRFRPMTLPDRFIDHNTQDAQYIEAGLDAASIVKTALSALGLPQSRQMA
ncbi:MAG: 1-deoxy-D-xylulose-5-phosphate synthase, partial [Komagataeibacter rhaeticus]|nr:1-deoxy-D-xylulose-5-phosphate synthase [Komagataeibacter rhaeticus]